MPNITFAGPNSQQKFPLPASATSVPSPSPSILLDARARRQAALIRVQGLLLADGLIPRSVRRSGRIAAAAQAMMATLQVQVAQQSEEVARG